MKIIDFYWKENDWTFFDKSVNKMVFHPVIEKHANFYFINDVKEIGNINSYFVEIIGNNLSKEDLMNNYYTKFKFPYFGFNWDALWDCLCDLDWIGLKDIIIYHEVLPKLEDKDFKIYFKILRDAIGNWNIWNEHNFKVYFNLKNYEETEKIIESSLLNFKNL
ncbi:MAG: barstar family protein [Dysgonamonadaceae bacterium]|jgi:RNAse (barnase) inhibitor barstar|nr:barstar family protein [Dysgonamonadaceae bacterium]